MGPSLREVFTPLVAYALLLARAGAYRQRSFEELRREIDRLLEEQKTLVKRHDISPQDYDLACFAAVAWIDELVLMQAHGANRDLYDQWKRAPLQAERFRTANAGEEFFERLDRLTPAQREVAEVYHLALALGFRGRYYDDTHEYKLAEIRRSLGQRLPTPFLDLYEIEKQRLPVTPQPYGVEAPPVGPAPKPRSTLWAGVALAALAAAAVWALWPAAPPPPPPPPPAPAERTREAILADVEAAIRSFACCEVKVASWQAGLLGLDGRVDSEETRLALEQAVRGVPEVAEVRAGFSIVPRPFCEVLDLLEPFRLEGERAGMDLRVRPHKGCDGVYSRGEYLVVDVSARKPLGHVQADYYVADREYVAHLFPNPKQRDSRAEAATSLAIGSIGSRSQWKIEPPFGTELVTVVTSPRPLFAEPRLEPERTGVYVEALRAALGPDPAGSGIAAHSCFIRTQDR